MKKSRTQQNQAVCDDVIKNIIVPFLTPREIVRVSITCQKLKPLRNKLYVNLERAVLPQMEWMCDQKQFKKFTTKQLAELQHNLDTNTRVCDHVNWNNQPQLTAVQIMSWAKSYERLAKRSKNRDFSKPQLCGFLCVCYIRRFVPIIKLSVSGEETIHRYSKHWEYCKCLPPSQLYNKQVPVHVNFRICNKYSWYLNSKGSDRQQLLQLLSIIQNYLLTPVYGGLKNEMIVEWLSRVNILHVFV